jgi:hypothetical protein
MGKTRQPQQPEIAYPIKVTSRSGQSQNWADSHSVVNPDEWQIVIAPYAQPTVEPDEGKTWKHSQCALEGI